MESAPEQGRLRFNFAGGVAWAQKGIRSYPRITACRHSREGGFDRSPHEAQRNAGEKPNTAILIPAFHYLLRTVAEAYGMAKVAEYAGIQRESLYRSLSPSGNPTLKTLMAVMKAVGLRISAVPNKAHA